MQRLVVVILMCCLVVETSGGRLFNTMKRSRVTRDVSDVSVDPPLEGVNLELAITDPSSILTSYPFNLGVYITVELCRNPQPDCPPYYIPVCGSDGVTYDKVCQLLWQKLCRDSTLEALYYGECGGGCDSRVCSYLHDEYDPVCGSDGVTYSTLCAFEWAKECDDPELTIADVGECGEDFCSSPHACDLVYAPVCGSDGITYHNECELIWAQLCSDAELTFGYYGKCAEELCAEERNCADVDNPVCSTDRVTYKNKCLFLWDQFCENKDLIILVNKDCSYCDPRPCNDDVYEPLCGSNGITYDNDCQWKEATKCNSKIRIDHRGTCSGICKPRPSECTDEDYRPVCGSNGVTYDNKCYYDEARLCDRSLRIARQGTCSGICKPRPSECTDEDYRPVCGSNGITYDNKCYFDEAKLCDRSLFIARRGTCSGVCKPRPSECTGEDSRPVCGSNGITYDNKCYYDEARLCDQSLVIAHTGMC